MPIKEDVSGFAGVHSVALARSKPANPEHVLKRAKALLACQNASGILCTQEPPASSSGVQTHRPLKQAVLDVSSILSHFSNKCCCDYGDVLAKVLKLLKSGKEMDASRLLSQHEPFPAISARLYNWERYLPTDSGIHEKFESLISSLPQAQLGKPASQKKKVGIVGSGICGMSAAKCLAHEGYEVDVYEALHKPGGFLRYAVPSFMLPREILDSEIKSMEDAGIRFLTNHIVGKLTAISEMSEQYDALFLAAGACHPRMINIEGAHLSNVCHANEYLFRINMMGSHKSKAPFHSASNTIVVGGGTVALYCARIAKSFGNNTTVVYRRSLAEMTARPCDIRKAKQEGVSFLELTKPLKIVGEKKADGVLMGQMMLEAEDDSGRKSPVLIEDTEFFMPADQIIMAVGETQNPTILRGSGLSTGLGNKLVVNEKMQTSKEGIFAGGDIVKQSNDIRAAIESGMKGAQFVHQYLQNSQ